jgi:hypothetical protein
MRWLIVVLVLLLYVHLFNAIARLYFESGRTLALKDIWRRFFPGIKIQIEL